MQCCDTCCSSTEGPRIHPKQRLQNDVAVQLVARIHIKNQLDQCNVIMMKLEMLWDKKDAMVAKYRETKYDNRVMDLIDRLLESLPAFNNVKEVVKHDNNYVQENTPESA